MPLLRVILTLRLSLALTLKAVCRKKKKKTGRFEEVQASDEGATCCSNVACKRSEIKEEEKRRGKETENVWAQSTFGAAASDSNETGDSR